MPTYEVKLTLSAEDISFILGSALGGSGISYWANNWYAVNPRGGFPKGKFESEALTNGCFINIYDMEGEKWHRLTLKKFLSGVGLALKAGVLDLEDYDGPQADSVVQYALFGKELYA